MQCNTNEGKAWCGPEEKVAGIERVAVKAWRGGADGAGMELPSEPVLIAVGMGLGAFLLAFSRIMTAEAKRALDVHFVHVKAVELRNAYARSILALRPGAGAEAEAGEEIGEVEVLDTPTAEEATEVAVEQAA